MPTLVCDEPGEGENVEYYTISGLPGNPKVFADPDPDIGFSYDLEDVPAGDYDIRVSACNEWMCSLPAPFLLSALGKPSAPTGLRIELI